jgi:hypothetical protein
MTKTCCSIECLYAEVCTHPGSWIDSIWEKCPTVRMIDEAEIFAEINGEEDNLRFPDETLLSRT